MNTVCLPAAMWHGERASCATVVRRIAERSSTESASFVIDRESVMRQTPDVEAEQAFFKLAFRDWIKPGALDEDVIDIERIRTSCREFPSASVIVVDASGYKTETIVRALFQARVGMHARAEWPHVFALVCDESQVFQLAQPLASAFFIQPAILSPVMIQRMVKRLAKDGKSLRLFGKNLGSIAVIARRWSKHRTEKKERKAARALGWVWEE
ncbi:MULTISPECIES: hypothetical protein [Paraburkholderia]|uniref:hypothetical protein n=1 Tax=Paraburkholderia TaxID=1822464 RepID=UPI0038BB6399